MKPEDVSTAEVHNPEGHASREEPAAAVPPKQASVVGAKITSSAGRSGSHDEPTLPVQVADFAS